MITHDKEMTWQFFKKKIMKNCKEDPEDEDIYYHTEAARKASLQYRTLHCMIHNCASKQ